MNNDSQLNIYCVVDQDVLAILPTYDLYRVYLSEERDDEVIRDKWLLFYSGSIPYEEYHKLSQTETASQTELKNPCIRPLTYHEHQGMFDIAKLSKVAQ